MLRAAGYKPSELTVGVYLDLVVRVLPKLQRWKNNRQPTIDEQAQDLIDLKSFASN